MLTYVLALAAAGAVYLVAFLIWFVPVALVHPGEPGLQEAALGGIFWDAVFGAVLTVVTGPLFVLWRRRAGERFTPGRAALAGALACPVHVLLVWGVVTLSGGVLAALFAAWRDLTGGLLVFVAWPAAVGGAVFAAGLARRVR
ncbi:MAG: hypothetical protein KGN76_12670 [Acidobacteriota bacterium]|nr:hypothetical protein [Acidobacteriota bacterium]